MPVSVIIPALNEETRVAAAIDAAFAAGAAEVVVADGGSSDATVDIAVRRGARVVGGETLRARQLNAGAAAANHDVLLFVHADTLLPYGAANGVEKAVADGTPFGGFRLAFIEPQWRLRCVAFIINLRTRLTRQPWGDQAQFAGRGAFEQAGGFPDYPLMEDYELARRMRRTFEVAILPLEVRTSGRRFLEKGVVRTSILNWTVIAAYHLGVDPARLAQWYRKSGRA